MKLTALWALIRKDLLIFFGDRRSVMISIITPVLLATFFGYIFNQKGRKEQETKIQIRIVSQDMGDITAKIIQQMDEDKSLELFPTTMEEAQESIQRGQATVAIVFPVGFGTTASRAYFRAADKPVLRVLYDPSHRNELAVVKGVITNYVTNVLNREAFRGQNRSILLKESMEKLNRDSELSPDNKIALQALLKSAEDWMAREEKDARMEETQKFEGFTTPYEIHEEEITAEGVVYNGFAHAFAGMGVQFILFMALDGGVALLMQRQRGLWKRFRAAPISRLLLLGSRAISTSLIALMILMILFGIGYLAFNVKIQGSLIGFLGVGMAFALMVSALGLFIAAIGKTPEATRGIGILSILILVMLGGAWVPSFLFPSWLQKITLITPTRWAVDGLEGMSWRGLGIGDAMAPIAVLLGYTVLFGVLAVTRFRWEAD